MFSQDDVAFSSLDRGDVGEVETGLLGQSHLTETQALPAGTDAFARQNGGLPLTTLQQLQGVQP